MQVIFQPQLLEKFTGNVTNIIVIVIVPDLKMI